MQTNLIFQGINLLFFLWQKTRLIRSASFLGECRFYPSCSEYSLNAINKHGFFYGIFLSIKRILKCNPFFKGGIDEV